MSRKRMTKKSTKKAVPKKASKKKALILRPPRRPDPTTKSTRPKVKKSNV